MSISIETAREIVEWYQWTYFETMDGCGEEGWTHDPRLEKMAEQLYDKAREDFYGRVCVACALKEITEEMLTDEAKSFYFHCYWDDGNEDPFAEMCCYGLPAIAKRVKHDCNEADNKAAKDAAITKLHEDANQIGEKT